MTPRSEKAPSALWSGVSAWTVFSSASSTTRSPTSGPVSKAQRGSAPSAPATPAGISTSVSGAVGKSSVSEPSSPGVATSTPLRVANRTGPSCAPVLRRTCAVASVAWPHIRTSATGVNHRSAQSASPPLGSRCANAVSAWLTSRATRCIHASSGKDSSSSTPAGFPPNGRSVKASTIRIRIRRR
jgi:hypothetical protein